MATAAERHLRADAARNVRCIMRAAANHLPPAVVAR
jgi:hypothetical protein